MSQSETRKTLDYNSNVQSYTQGTPVKITKGSLRGCQGKISGFTSNGLYFVVRDKCDRDAEGVYNPIDLLLPNEFERLN